MTFFEVTIILFSFYIWYRGTSISPHLNKTIFNNSSSKNNNFVDLFTWLIFVLFILAVRSIPHIQYPEEKKQLSHSIKSRSIWKKKIRDTFLNPINLNLICGIVNFSFVNNYSRPSNRGEKQSKIYPFSALRK